MFHAQRVLFFGFIPFAIFFFPSDFNHLSARLVVPTEVEDTTDKMNTGGDPADRPGLASPQPNPEYHGDWWGPRDYYYGGGYPEGLEYRNPYQRYVDSYYRKEYYQRYVNSNYRNGYSPNPYYNIYYRGPEAYNPRGAGYPYYSEYQRTAPGHGIDRPAYYSR